MDDASLSSAGGIVPFIASDEDGLRQPTLDLDQARDNEPFRV